MSWTVVTGIIIALMFLVSFSQWFYELISGLNGIIVEDIYVVYRTIAWGLGSILFMGAVFWILAIVKECPDLSGERPGIFAYMDCRLYWQGRKLVTGQSIPDTTINSLDSTANPSQ